MNNNKFSDNVLNSMKARIYSDDFDIQINKFMKAVDKSIDKYPLFIYVADWHTPKHLVLLATLDLGLPYAALAREEFKYNESINIKETYKYIIDSINDMVIDKLQSLHYNVHKGETINTRPLSNNTCLEYSIKDGYIIPIK